MVSCRQFTPDTLIKNKHFSKLMSNKGDGSKRNSGGGIGREHTNNKYCAWSGPVQKKWKNRLVFLNLKWGSYAFPVLEKIRRKLDFS